MLLHRRYPGQVQDQGHKSKFTLAGVTVVGATSSEGKTF